MSKLEQLLKTLEETNEQLSKEEQELKKEIEESSLLLLKIAKSFGK